MMRDDLAQEIAEHGGTIEITAENRWLSLRLMKVPELGINGYAYVHTIFSDGNCIAILPFKQEGGVFQVLLRKEVVPPWGLSPSLCSITGAWDDQTETFEQTALRELYEEAGFTADYDEIIFLGTCRGTKATDTTFHLYAVNVTGKTPVEAPGDGTFLEAQATTVWCTLEEATKDTPDPLVCTLVLRLAQKEDC
jgi:8-oxo-dGTP pyrophosphatase MutT (NUDIX family)